MHFLILTKENCSYCIKTKKLLNDNKHSYLELDFSKDTDIEFFKEMGETSFPIIYQYRKDNTSFNRIGGYNELEVYLARYNYENEEEIF